MNLTRQAPRPCGCAARTTPESGYRPERVMATHLPSFRIEIGAELAALAPARTFVRESAASLGAARPVIDDLVQAVDEWVTNVIVHGYAGRPGSIEIELIPDGRDVLAVVRDRCPTFDPANAPPFDPRVPLEQRRPGGMGIHLMHELADSIEHRALPDGGNEVTIRRAVGTAAGGQR